MNLVRIKLFVFLFVFQITITKILYGQKVSEVAKYSTCKLNLNTGEEYDCQKKWGQIMFSKITIVPNKEIITNFIKEVNGVQVVHYNWDNKYVRMNSDKDLYIYTLLDKDINFEGGMMISLIIRLDYTIQLVKISQNINGSIINTTLYTE